MRVQRIIEQPSIKVTRTLDLNEGHSGEAFIGKLFESDPNCVEITMRLENGLVRRYTRL